jgi:hypothetical protein
MNLFIPRLLVVLCLTGGLKAAGETPVVTFDLLRKTVHPAGSPAVLPKQLTALEGKKVRVTGHVCPYDQHMLRLMKFLVTAEQNPGCFFCNPPDETEVFFIRLPANAVPMTWKSEMVTVEGTLHLKGRDKADKEAAPFLATVDEAVVVGRK